MIKRLATFGWLGDDGGARMAWVALHGWAAAYTDATPGPERTFRAPGESAVFTAPGESAVFAAPR